MSIQILDSFPNCSPQDQTEFPCLLYLILFDPDVQRTENGYWNKREASEYIFLKLYFKSDHLLLRYKELHALTRSRGETVIFRNKKNPYA